MENFLSEVYIFESEGHPKCIQMPPNVRSCNFITLINFVNKNKYGAVWICSDFILPVSKVTTFVTSLSVIKINLKKKN